MELEKLNLYMQNNEPFSHTSTKINLRWVIEINAKPNTIKLLEENTEGTLCDPGIGEDFSDSTRKDNVSIL